MPSVVHTQCECVHVVSKHPVMLCRPACVATAQHIPAIATTDTPATTPSTWTCNALLSFSYSIRSATLKPFFTNPVPHPSLSLILRHNDTHREFFFLSAIQVIPGTRKSRTVPALCCQPMVNFARSVLWSDSRGKEACFDPSR